MIIKQVTTKSLNQINFNNHRIINTINPHSYLNTQSDKVFFEALKSSDVLLPDGIGIVWAKRLLYKNKIKKIAGYDLFLHLMNDLNNKKGSCFFLGASDNTLKMIITRASKEFPNVSVHCYSPPYKKEFTNEDNVKMYTLVNKVEPDILFVGMTAPKQEKWVYNNNININVKLICSIGAVFDFYSGTVSRPSKFWIKSGLEWLPRFLYEPIRLAKRNLISTPKFILQVLYMKISKKNKS
jgi:N-acetylglucosaminyldiphosphoundecaprenol N-acetyl-beta-D-mannosaminyltransferase